MRDCLKLMVLCAALFSRLYGIGMIPASAANAASISSTAQQPSKATVKGKVTDAITGDPVIGASVLLKGTNTGAITDIDGKYEISAAAGSVLQVSSIGYKTKQITVVNTVIDIPLEQDAESLDDVVVIGYGTARKKDLTGSISNIKAEKFAEQAPRSVYDILRSNAAGLNIGLATDAKADASIGIRGDGTLAAGSSPLIVLDGVIYEGAMTDINPQDIASIDILKDASAAAVYGAKSANGVVAITTKRGKTGKPVITFDASLALAHVSSQPSLLTPEQFLKFRQDYNEGRNSDEYLAKYPQIFQSPFELNSVSQLDWYNYDQTTPVASVSEQELTTKWLSRLNFTTPEIENFFAGKTTRWDDLVFQTALQQSYTVGVSAASERLSQYYSVNYADREGITAGDLYKNLRFRANVETKITDFLRVGMNASFASRDESGLPCSWSNMKDCTPYSTNNIDDPTSKYQKLPNGLDPVNPFYENKYTDKKRLYQTINAKLYAKVNLPFDIEYEFDFTPNIRNYENYIHHSSASSTYSAKGGQSERTYQKDYSWQIDNILRWKKMFANDHNVEVTLLANSEKTQSWMTSATVSGYSPNDKLGYHALGFATVPTATSDDWSQTGDALMARLFYSYADKYMLTASIRRDGFSAFGKKNPHALFSAFALGWVFSKENFARNASWLNYGKLRLSWGENGNRDIGRYAALSTMSSSLAPYIDASGKVYTTSWMNVNTMANYNLRWERSASFNIGLDFAVLNNILTGSIEAYDTKTNDLLVNRILPNVTGFSSVTANLGQLQNRGLEFTLNANIIDKDELHWSISGNMSMNRRKINRLYGDMEDILDDDGNIIGQRESDDITSGWFIGQDPDRIWAYERQGVWQLDEAQEAAKYGCQPGDFKYIDQNSDGIMNNDDKVFQGYKTPRVRWGLRTDLTWKSFSFAANLYSFLNYYAAFNQAANNNGFPDRCSNYYFPRWTYSNPINDYARIGSKNIGNNYVNKSFIRLENVNLAYNVPKSFTQRFAVQSMRLMFNIQNPFVYSKDWTFWDPENGSLCPRTITFGVNVTL